VDAETGDDRPRGTRSDCGREQAGDEIDEFVPKKEIVELYFNNPYFIVPDGEVGQQPFALIRETIRQEGMAAWQGVFTSREQIIAPEARDKGLLGVTLRYLYEVRKEEEYFDDRLVIRIGALAQPMPQLQ
jgi:DNA end-binding protein Ku